MRLLDKFQEKESIFVFDERDSVFAAQLNDIKFICEKVKDNYEQYAKDLADAYKSKLSVIVDFILPDVQEMFGVSDVSAVCNALGKPQIDLDRSLLSYCELTLDDTHIIDIEFGGVFTDFYYVSMDG